MKTGRCLSASAHLRAAAIFLNLNILQRSHSMDMKILFISPEAVPFAKTGGLADVAGALPVALKKLGVDVRVALPFYQAIRDRYTNISPLLHEISVRLGSQSLRADIFETHMQEKVPVYLIGQDAFYDRPGLYGDAKGDYPDNLERFSFFCHASLCIPEVISFSPDIVHCHDWQTGLVPALIKGVYRHRSLQRTMSVFTVHNAGYQGIFPPEKFSVTGLPLSDFFHIEGFEYWGKLSLLKGGIIYSDAITTVSRKYAEEILTPEYGMGMEGVFLKRKDALHGILNGVEYEHWNPETDAFIPSNYNYKDIRGKKDCKRDLITETGLDRSILNRPLLSMVTRLDTQKGIDLVIAAADKIVQMDAALIILGKGSHDLHERLVQTAMRHPDRIKLKLDFDECLAHRIMAGSDMILIPSRYEPCGLTQMYALKYGTVPVVRATGGLDDTVSEFDVKTGRGNGFKFVPYSSDALVSAIKRACDFFSDTSTWHTIMLNGMKADFSWDRSVKEYMKLYNSLLLKQD